MKRLYLSLIAFLLIGAALHTKAQTIVFYNFEFPAFSNPSTAPSSVSAGLTASNVTAVGLTNVSVSQPGSGVSGPNPAAYALEASGWPTTAVLDPNKYVQFTLTPQSSCSFVMTSFIIYDRVDDGADPGFTSVRSSADGFASNFSATPQAVDGDFQAHVYSGSTLPTPPRNTTYTFGLTFRIYYYGTASPVRLDRISMNGQVFCPPPMPVDLVSFEGKAMTNKVHLNWSTSWERNADRFEVERSQNALEFGSIGQVKAAGDATDKRFYGFSDEQALTGLNYYRLRQVDRDGSVRYSKIIAVTTRPEAPAIAILGNPADKERITIQLFNVEASQLRLTDMQGRSVPFRLVESVGNTVSINPVGLLTSGLYLIGADNVPAVKVVIP